MTEADRPGLIGELLDAFIAQGYVIKGVVGDARYPSPLPLKNDGYGDQEAKRPPILAYDTADECFLVGLARASYEDLSSETSLTEYDVFLDQVDPKTKKPFRLFVIVEPGLVVDLNSLIHHYIHREYWHRVMVVAARTHVN